MATSWYSDAELHLAREKTEVLLLTRKRIPISFTFDVGDGGEISTIYVVKYLGVLLDNGALIGRRSNVLHCGRNRIHEQVS